MQRCSFFRPFVLLLTLFGSGLVSASAVQSRIAGNLSDSARVSIPNSVHGRVRLGTDLGPTAANTQLEGMTLRFSLTQTQQAALDQLLADQQNPSSPRFHQWLTPAQYGAQFGLSPADLAKVTGWLTSQGFTITEVANSATYVRFNGTVAQAQAAFSTSIHNLLVNGNIHFANITDASIPAPLGSVVTGVTGLHNFRLKPRVQTRIVKAAPLRSQFTSSISSDHYIAPGDFYTIYNETPVLTSAIDGRGITIAIMGQVDISLPDIAAFRTASGLSVNPPRVLLYGADPGNGATCSNSSVNCPTPNLNDLQESSLDVEWAGASAPGASILFVNSKDVISTSLTDAIDNNVAPIMSISYGDCESSWGTNELNTLNQLFKQANAQGITIVGPAGDDGSTDCDYNNVSAVNGLAVDFPASSPYVTGMGGTMFNEGTATGGTSYWSASDTTISAGSSVTGATASALSYLPEATWNEDITGGTFSAGGGGASNFFTKPAWQTGPGVPSDASRDVPDLSLNSAASHDGYLYCASNSCVNGTFRASDGQSLTVGGGTSFATPSFAGILALIEQKTGSRIGNANPSIYALANDTAFYNSTTNSVFHDVTTGNNNSPCTAGTPNCPAGGTIGYSAGTGYDLVTGWGSLNVFSLVNAWNVVPALGSGALGSAISATTVTATPTSVTAGAAVTFNATVTGVSGSPTGTVQFLVNNTPVGTPVQLSAGVASYSYPTTCSTIGQLIVSASYSGDATYAGSKGAGITANGSSTVTPVQVAIKSGSCPDFTLTPTSSAVTVASGTPSSTITVKSINGFAGTVTLSASATETSSTLPAFTFNPTSVTLAANSSATTTLTLSNITAQLHAPDSPGGPRHATPWYAGGSGITLATLLFLVLPRRRRLGALLLVALSCALVAGTSGCGSGKNSTIVPNSNTQIGAYTVTVTATSSASGSTIAHSTTVVFNVQ